MICILLFYKIQAPIPDTVSSGHVLDTPADNLTEQVEGDSKNQELPAVPDMDTSEDAGFTVKIQAPGTESTDFQVKARHLQEFKRSSFRYV